MDPPAPPDHVVGRRGLGRACRRLDGRRDLRQRGAGPRAGRPGQAGINLKRSNANFQLARQAVDDYLTRVSENTLLKAQPSGDLRSLRKALLGDALKFYKTFILQRGDDPSLRRQLAGAYARVGMIADEIGTKSEALAAHEKALEIRRSLADADPSDVVARVELAESLDTIGVLYRSLGRMTECLDSLEAGRAALEDLVTTRPDRSDAQYQFAQVCSDLGAVRKMREEFEQAESMYARAHAILAHLVEVDPAEPKYLRKLAWFTYLLGNVLSDPRRKDLNLEGAKAHYDAALALHQKLIIAHPGEPDYPIDMAQCYVSLNNLFTEKGDYVAGIGYLEDALRIQRKVVASHPTVTLYLLDLSATLYNLGFVYTRVSKLDDALRSYQESIDVAERLVELDPEDIEFQDRLGRTVCNLGSVLGDQGKDDQAVATYRRAVDIHRKILAKAPGLPRYRRALLIPLLNLAESMNKRGRPDEAVAFALEARRLTEGFPEYHVQIASRLSTAGGLVAEGRAERGRYLDLAMESLRDAVTVGLTPREVIRTDTSFAPLHRRKDFQILIYDPDFPADPFARGG